MIYNKLISVNRKHDVEQLKHRCYFIVLNDSINLFPEHKNCIHYAIFMFSTQPTNIYLNLCLRSLINRSRCRNYQLTKQNLYDKRTSAIQATTKKLCHNNRVANICVDNYFCLLQNVGIFIEFQWTTPVVSHDCISDIEITCF